MPIDPNRISGDIETVAGFNESSSDIGYSRPTFSKASRAARDYVIAQAEAAGCKVRIDAAGNVHARHASIPWGGKVWLSGSHIDSVPTGGKYDGVVGVVVPLEILRTAHNAGEALPLELVVFAEEEGTTFGIGAIGTRAATLAPLLPTAMLFVASKDGISHNPAEFSRIAAASLLAKVVAES